MLCFIIQEAYRTCNDLRFCSENINAAHPSLSILSDSITFDQNIYSAELNIVNGTSYDMKIYKIKDSGFRFRVDPNENLTKYCFKFDKDNILVNSQKLSTTDSIQRSTS